MASYLDFYQLNVPSEIKKQFITEARGMKLDQIITNSKNTIRTSFFQSTKHPNVYLIMIVGMKDNVLIKLAHQCGFPRGFPILWIVGISMQYFGFYPKFSNDVKQKPDNLSEINTVTKIDFFKKWSGFLSQVLAFEINGQVYWTVTSKNSADCNSLFISDAKRLFEPLMTNNVVEQMTQQRLHFCAEIMSKNDQVHGSRVLTESPVITLVGIGKFYDLAKPIKDNDKLFVKFLTNQDLVCFCKENNLPCDSAITISNTYASRNFLSELSKNRDFMTDIGLQKIINKFESDINIMTGTVNHADILGDCLEGLVIKLYKTNGSTEIKKYKFANYTIRTMLLRSEFQKFSFDSNLIRQTESYTDHWCVSQEGKEFWKNFALECFMEYNDHHPVDPIVGSHILVAELIGLRANEISDALVRFNQKLSNKSLNTIIICIGPIGSGKTTFANKLAASNSKFVVIDGDILDLGIETTMKLSVERNDYTRWKIIEAIMMGKIPIVSCGGGILFSSGKNQMFNLPQQILTTLKIQCKIIVCIPSNDCQQVMLSDSNFNVDNLYKRKDLVRATVIRRIKSGEWSLDKKFLTGKVSEQTAINNFVNFIASKSEENMKFAKQLIAIANCVFTYPLITNNNYGIYDNFDFSSINSNVTFGSEILMGKFSQIRLLTMIDNQVGHITWKYDASINISFSLDDFRNLSQMYPSVVPGFVQKVTSNDGKSVYTFAVPAYAIHPDGSTHITIKSGNHAPKETGTIVRAINSGQQTVSIPDKSKKSVVYDLRKIVSNACYIHILAAFGI